jgi:DNA transformation protein
MQEFLEECLGKLPDFEIRSMFGGAGMFAEGTMFGILHRGRVYFKTSPSTRAGFTELGMKAFQPPRGAALKSYYEVPPDVVDDETALGSWARRAVAAAAAPSRSTKARTVEPTQILEGYSPAIRGVVELLREIVRQEAPDAEEAGYVGWKLIGYRAPHYFCFVAPHRDHVRLGFEYGVRLSDPDRVLEPMGKQVRFVRCAPGQALPTASMRALIRAALNQSPPSRR